MIRTQFIEQRWGARFRLNTPAELRAPDVLPGEACVRDVSLSGAFVETSARLPMHARLSVRPLCRPGQWVDAAVVRTESRGVAVKWLEPGLRPVSTLLPSRRPGAPDPVSAAGRRTPERKQLVHRLAQALRGRSRAALVIARTVLSLLAGRPAHARSGSAATPLPCALPAP